MSALLRVNGRRLLDHLLAQGQIGWVEGLGLDRDAYSPAYQEARKFARACMEAAGMTTRADSVGNLFGLLPGSDSGAPRILAGSHLDAVRGGGIYDGAYGVFAAIEAAHSLREQGIRLRRGLEAVAFIGEEGGPLGGTFGSRALCGLVRELPAPAVLAERGLSAGDIAAAKAAPHAYACYLEAHIEQGPMLERRGLDIGIPTGIVGIARYRCRVHGEANHAGTTPMAERKDALYAGIHAIDSWLRFMGREPEMVCNVAEIAIAPGQIGVVAGEFAFTVEIRSQRQQDTDRAVSRLRDILADVPPCRAEMELLVAKPAARLDPQLIALVDGCCQRMGVRYQQMPSGASHDASPLARTMPAAMIFVPSRLGISHNPDEYTAPAALVKGAEALLNTIAAIDALPESDCP